MSDLEVIAQLLQVGVGALGIYLFWTERKAHGDTRTEYIKAMRELQEARILDYKVWLDMLGDIITSGNSRALYPPTDRVVPVKSAQPPKS